MTQDIKLLYVDDEELNRQMFKIHFGNDFEVYTVEDGEKGLEALETIDGIIVVISDMKMPKMNGVEFVKIAKERFPQKKFYILTGFEITAEIREALESGLIVKFFNKPFNINEITESIQEVLANDL